MQSLQLLDGISYGGIETSFGSQSVDNNIFLSDLAQGISLEHFQIEGRGLDYNKLKKYSKIVRESLIGATNESVNLLEAAYQFNIKAAESSNRNNRNTRHIYFTAAEHARQLATLSSNAVDYWHNIADKTQNHAIDLAVADGDYVDEYNGRISLAVDKMSRLENDPQRPVKLKVEDIEIIADSIGKAYEVKMGHYDQFERELVKRRWNDEGEAAEDRRKLERSNDFLVNKMAISCVATIGDVVTDSAGQVGLTIRHIMGQPERLIGLAAKKDFPEPVGTMQRSLVGFGKIVSVLESLVITNSNIVADADPDMDIVEETKLALTNAVGNVTEQMASYYGRIGALMKKIKLANYSILTKEATFKRDDFKEFRKRMRDIAREREGEGKLTLPLTERIVTVSSILK